VATAERKRDSQMRADSERASTATARTEVVDILAGALFTLLLEGRTTAPHEEEKQQLGEIS
jgi:hypothetical protein